MLFWIFGITYVLFSCFWSVVWIFFCTLLHINCVLYCVFILNFLIYCGNWENGANVWKFQLYWSKRPHFFCFKYLVWYVLNFIFVLVFIDVLFDIFELNIIFDIISSYIRLHSEFRFVVSKYYYGISGLGKFPNIFNRMDLNKEYCSSWPQSLTFECREIRKRKNMNSHRAHLIFVYLSIGILVTILLKEMFWLMRVML